jgi:hypothetical protein
MAHEIGMEFNATKGWVVGPDWDPHGEWRSPVDPAPGRCFFLWQQAVVNNDGGVAPCCGTFYREDDMGRVAVDPAEVGSATFREVWNGEKFRAARRLYRSRTGSDDTRKSICFDCPATIIWENWLRHAAARGTLDTFQPGYSANDCFNYFYNRRPVRAEARR